MEASDQKRKKRITFEFDERSYETLDEIKRQCGVEFEAVTAKNPITGETREWIIPVLR